MDITYWKSLAYPNIPRRNTRFPHLPTPLTSLTYHFLDITWWTSLTGHHVLDFTYWASISWHHFLDITIELHFLGMTSWTTTTVNFQHTSSTVPVHFLYTLKFLELPETFNTFWIFLDLRETFSTFLETSWKLPGCSVTLWILRGRFLGTSLTPGNFMKTSWRLHGDILKTVYTLHVHSMNTFWTLPEFLNTSWHFMSASSTFMNNFLSWTLLLNTSP